MCFNHINRLQYITQKIGALNLPFRVAEVVEAAVDAVGIFDGIVVVVVVDAVEKIDVMVVSVSSPYAIDVKPRAIPVIDAT